MENIILLAAFVAYFIPTMVAWNKKAFNGIATMNLLLGWTVIFWIAALIWAFESKRVEKNA
jgi:hypothetical protein